MPTLLHKICHFATLILTSSFSYKYNSLVFNTSHSVQLLSTSSFNGNLHTAS